MVNKKDDQIYRPLWIEVNLNNLHNNLLYLRSYLNKEVRFMATIKQQAYGHGLVPVAEFLKDKVDFFAVASIEEGRSLRQAGIKNPILVLSAVMPSFVEQVIKYKLRTIVFDMFYAKQLNKIGIKRNMAIPVHIKVDTGMGRLGIWYKEALEFIEKLKKMKGIYLEGIFTHFPAADTDRDFTNFQIKEFSNLLNKLLKAKIKIPIVHTANSIALIDYPCAHFNLVRPGLSLYGVSPARKIKDLKPVLSLKAKVIFSKKILKGHSVSYGRSFISRQAIYIATLPVGYGDGYPWRLSNKGKVIIKGKLFPIAGRVCMDHTMVNLGRNNSIKQGDEVILIGGQGKSKITAENLAEWAGTIPYEILTRLSLSIPRIYYSN